MVPADESKSLPQFLEDFVYVIHDDTWGRCPGVPRQEIALLVSEY